jgi:hypothetical protein
MITEIFMNLTKINIHTLKNIYYIVANTLITLVIIVVCSHFILKHINFATHFNYVQTFSRDRREAYSHMSDQDINELLNSTWSPAIGGWDYDELVGFKETPRNTKYVNVNEYSIRQNSSTPIDMNELNGSIWFFGGSTTFGYGVADSETIPAQLERTLNRRVINFGRGFFYSDQENELLSQYLLAGYRPKLVIFLDGINERCEIEVYQRQMEALFYKASKYSWGFTNAFEPVTLLTNKLITKYGVKYNQKYADSSVKGLHALSCKIYGKEQPLSSVLQENLKERKSICDQYSVKCQTFVQPFAGVHGIHSDRSKLTTSERKQLRDKFLFLKTTWENSGSIFVTDALDNLNKHAYVDDCHYSAKASELIAKEIARKLYN